MANYFMLTLDISGPTNPSLTIEGGLAYALNQIVNVSIGCGDASKTGYKMKIWGDVDTSNNVNIQNTEALSKYINYAETIQVKLNSSEGNKQLYLRVMDDVGNESGIASDTIYLDLTAPVVSISNGPDIVRISKVAGKDTTKFSFTADTNFIDYKVCVVANASDANNLGVIVPVAYGSKNTSGNGTFLAGSLINVELHGADIEQASIGDGNKTIKVFVKETSGRWSL